MFSKSRFEAAFDALALAFVRIDDYDIEAGITKIRDGIPGYRKEYLVKRFGVGSNEALWSDAMDGEKRALDKLYLQLNGLWRSSTPTDKSRMLNCDDWMQLAAEAFVEKWKKYKPYSGFRFSTFMMTVVTRHWYNELKRLGRGYKEIDNTKVLVDDMSKGYESLLVSEFCLYNDDGYFDYYVQRFHGYLKNNVDSVTLRVFESPLEEKDSTSLADNLGLSKEVARQCIRNLKQAVLDFCQAEKDLIYAA